MDLHHCQSLTMAWLRLLNSLGPRDAIRRCRSGPTLGQVMACCLTAPSHYLTQCWLITRRPSDFHLRSISREIPQPQTPTIRLKIPYLNFQSNLQGGNELTHWGQNKWLLFCRRHLEMHLVEWKLQNFKWYFIETCPYSLIHNMSALVQIMAWHWTGHKPLSNPMMTHLYASPGFNELYWGLNKMADILQMRYYKAFYEREFLWFYSNFTDIWVLFSGECQKGDELTLV